MGSSPSADDREAALALLEPSTAIGDFDLLKGWPIKPITFFLYGDHSDD